MSKLKENIAQIQAQKGWKATWKKKLFGGIYKALEAAQEDAENREHKFAEEKRILEQQLAEERRTLEQLRNDFESACVNLRHNNDTLDTNRSELDLLKVQMREVQRGQGGRQPVKLEKTVENQTVLAKKMPEETYQAIEYFDFENHFRGSVAHIKKMQEQYLPYFSGKQHVLDLGCGRGEFLSLMHDYGIQAKGVDLYAPYVEYCIAQGLEAVCGDGIAYLAQQEQVDGIFVGQVVEHLQTEQIVRLCEIAYEKLSQGGCMVIETPNPTSLSIYTNAFYIDPSHIKPVHPLTMQYYLEKAGFQNIEILYTESSKPDRHIPVLRCAGENIEEFNTAMQQVAQMLYGSQDYAAIAIKT